MSAHNEAKPGDYAETVLLPGDPLRAKWVAANYLEDAKLVNQVRNCLGYTGTWQGRPISVQATGMGQPSISIYVHELINDYGVRNLIRIGTAGGINTKVKVRDLVLAQAVSTDSTITRGNFGHFNFAPTADFGLLRAAAQRADELGYTYHVGNMASSDIFYVEGGAEYYAQLTEHGVLAVEMEAAALYTLATRFGVKALAICTISDDLITGEEIDAGQRQTSLDTMVRLALDLGISL
ncbi:MAG: purine-nucleoside phosphorylase [Candidatus Nanopelagicales bacterium]